MSILDKSTRQKTNPQKAKFNLDTSDSRFQSVNSKDMLSTKDNKW
jgi:hypothetical protein